MPNGVKAVPLPVNISGNNNNNNNNNMNHINHQQAITIEGLSYDVSSSDSHSSEPSSSSSSSFHSAGYYRNTQTSAANTTTSNTNNNTNYHVNQTIQYLDFYQRNLFEKWEIYGDAIHIVTNLADHIVQEVLDKQTSSTGGGGGGDYSAESNSNTILTMDGMQQIFATLSLYTYALNLLKFFLQNFQIPEEHGLLLMESSSNNNHNNNNNINGGGQNNNVSISSTAITTSTITHEYLQFFHQMKLRLIQMFDDLLERLEHGRQWIQRSQVNIPNLELIVMVSPKAEFLMLQEVLTLENDAEMEEVLGNFER
jgi:hypothetical protein